MKFLNQKLYSFKSGKITDFLLEGLVYVVLLLFLFPFFWLILTSFKNQADQLAWPPIFIPKTFTLSHYIQIFSDASTLKSFFNTVIVSITSTFFSVAIGSAAAYSLSRVGFTRIIRNITLTWFLVSRMYPAIATAVPYYLLMKNLGLLDTQLALILTYTGFNLPFVIWLMLGFFDGIPKELDQAAIMDSCNLWQRFTKIILPLSKPGLIATTIFSFNLAWNEFLFAIILTTDEAKTMPTVVAGFITDKGYEFGVMSSLGVVLIVPVIFLSLLTQRHMVRGLTMGAVKD